MAFLDPTEQAEALRAERPRLTGRTLVDAKPLRAELDRVRRDSLATEDQETIVGDAGIAAPVFDNRGNVVGAIGLTGPVERLLPGKASPPAAQLVREAARALSRELGAGRLAGSRSGT